MPNSQNSLKINRLGRSFQTLFLGRERTSLPRNRPLRAPAKAPQANPSPFLWGGDVPGGSGEAEPGVAAPKGVPSAAPYLPQPLHLPVGKLLSAQSLPGHFRFDFSYFFYFQEERLDACRNTGAPSGPRLSGKRLRRGGF